MNTPDDAEQRARAAQQRLIHYQTVTLPALLAKQKEQQLALLQQEQKQNSAG